MPSTIFADPIFPGAKIITASLSVSNTSGAYSTTVTDDRMTGSMKAIALEIDDPSVFNGKISVNATAGQYVFSCPDVAGSTTVVISFIKTADDPTQLTSSEFDVLNNRIGDLSALTTTAKTSAVAAINELDAESDVLNNRIGDLTALTTTAKTSAVEAINELDGGLATLANEIQHTDIQTLSSSAWSFSVILPRNNWCGGILMTNTNGGGNSIWFLNVQNAGTYVKNKLAANPGDPTVINMSISGTTLTLTAVNGSGTALQFDRATWFGMRRF